MNKASGIITRKIKLKMRCLINNWLLCLNNSPLNKDGYKLLYPTFVTLTLPSKQAHSDKELHQLLLARFIDRIKKSHGVRNYIWRAERQENGNLHYHIIVDKFIGWQFIRKAWNGLLKLHGYIDAYKFNQEEYHKNGFRLNVAALPKWSKIKQFEAYKKGVKSKWQNPNSTDIHSLKNIDDVSSYITKYITKSDAIDEQTRLERLLRSNTINQDFYDNSIKTIEAMIEAGRIHAKVWGHSKDLSEIKDPKIIIGSKEDQWISDVINDEVSRVVREDNFTVIYNKNLKDYIAQNSYIASEVAIHHLNNFYHLYKEFKPIKKLQQKEEIPILQVTIFKKARQAVLF